MSFTNEELEIMQACSNEHQIIAEENQKKLKQLAEENIRRNEISDEYSRKKHLLKSQLHQEIANTIVNIRDFVSYFKNNEQPFLDNQYNNLLDSIDGFKTCMDDEVDNLVNKNLYCDNRAWPNPIETVKKFHETIKTAFNPGFSWEEKDRAIGDFRDHARNAKLNSNTKINLGMLIGSVVGIAVTMLLLTALLGPAMVFTFPFWCFGGCIGAVIGVGASALTTANQRDHRGAQVTENLSSLNKARKLRYGTLFKQDKKEKRDKEPKEFSKLLTYLR